MPHKKNPDVPELIRGETGRVYGHLVSLLTILKGLPLTYNRDLQEDKSAVFDALDTVQASIGMLIKTVEGLTVQRQALAAAASSGFLLATELADYLVLKGVPFRTAHTIVGRIVRDRLDHGKGLADITFDELRSFSQAFEKDALDVLSVEGALERKLQIGGTAAKRWKLWLFDPYQRKNPYHLGPSERTAIWFPKLSLPAIAAYTPEHWDVEIQDESVRAIDLEYPADLVGISVMTCYAPRAYQ